MREWLRKFFSVRNGADQLSFGLLVLSIIITLIGRLANINFLAILSYIPLFMSIFRIFSKNIYARQMENRKFLDMINPMTRRINTWRRRFRERKTHKFFKCPKCRTDIRVPKDKGRIMITCPNCKTKFEKRT